MDTVSRRKFLKLTSGAAIVGATSNLLSLDQIAEAAIDRPLAPDTPILVVVTLYGGNDGLNTVIPFKDPIISHLAQKFHIKPRRCCPLMQILL